MILRKALAAGLCAALCAPPGLAAELARPQEPRPIELPAPPLTAVALPPAAEAAPQISPAALPAAAAPASAAPAPTARALAPARAHAPLLSLALSRFKPGALAAFWPAMLRERGSEGSAPPPVLPPTPAPLGRPSKRLRRFVGELLLGDRPVRPYLKPYRARMAGASALMLAGGAGGILQSWLSGRMIDAAIARQGHLAAALFGTLLGVHVIFTISDYVQKRVQSRLRLDVSRDVRVGLFEGLLRSSDAFLKRHSPSELSSRMVNDVEQIPNKNLDSPISLPYFAGMVVMSAGMILKSPHLGALMAVLIPVVAVISVRYGRRRKKLENDYTAVRAGLTRLGEEGLSASRQAKQQAGNSARYAAKADELRDSSMSIILLSMRNDFGIGFLGYFACYFVVIGLGLWNTIATGQPSVGEVLAMAGYAQAFRDALQGLINVVYTNNRAAEGMTRTVLALLSRAARARSSR